MCDPSCIPPLDACGIEAPTPGHYCHEIGPHAEHSCACGSWPRDLEFEMACALYVRHFTVPYTEAPLIPSQAVVWAACAPAGSHWRAMAQVPMRMMGVDPRWISTT